MANFTLGSGGAAILLGHQSELGPEELRPQIQGMVKVVDSSGASLCVGGASNEDESMQMQTDASNLLAKGLVLAKENFQQFLETLNWSKESITSFICHQVGQAHIDQLKNLLHLPKDRMPTTFEELGNMGTVSWPVTLMKQIEQEKVKGPLAIMGIGSGISSMMMGIHWQWHDQVKN